MLWFNKKAHLPPLISKGLSTDPLPGVLGQGGRIVFGGEGVDFHERSGGRFTLGFAVDQEWGVEGSYHFYGQRRNGFSADSQDGSVEFPVLRGPSSTSIP